MNARLAVARSGEPIGGDASFEERGAASEREFARWRWREAASRSAAMHRSNNEELASEREFARLAVARSGEPMAAMHRSKNEEPPASVSSHGWRWREAASRSAAMHRSKNEEPPASVSSHVGGERSGEPIGGDASFEERGAATSVSSHGWRWREACEPIGGDASFEERGAASEREFARLAVASGDADGGDASFEPTRSRQRVLVRTVGGGRSVGGEAPSEFMARPMAAMLVRRTRSRQRALARTVWRWREAHRHGPLL